MIDQKVEEALGKLYLQHLKNLQQIEDLQKELKEAQDKIKELENGSSS